MAKIYMNAPSHEVKNADVQFDIYTGSSILGRLKVSKGTIEWLPKNKSKGGRHLSWERFDELMKEIGWQKS